MAKDYYTLAQNILSGEAKNPNPKDVKKLLVKLGFIHVPPQNNILHGVRNPTNGRNTEVYNYLPHHDVPDVIINGGAINSAVLDDTRRAISLLLEKEPDALDKLKRAPDALGEWTASFEGGSSNIVLQ